ncbi:MAG: trigger factor [Candidatus Thioglobus sp.]|uniref:trigger factor n=1 Tax=Candidatus Thioglobus sp. TaxID=2026721 RepID=UPI002618BC14|nr:trigger factor [Candidatus Thioglobus sp.]MDC9727195.1 trigger factor [Candidatus Thioglobus sp.]
MKTSLETLEGLKRSLTVGVTIDMFNQKVEKSLKTMASQVSIDGFRKGKVPVSMVKQRFGDNAKSEAVNEIVNETLVEALTEVKLSPAARPTVTKIDSEGETEFFYTVEFEVFPTIEMADFSGLEIDQIEVDITKADEDRTLNGLQEQLTEYKAVKRKSKAGDRLALDFVGTIEGEKFEGGEATDFKLVLGKGTMIPGFEDSVTGVEAGKTVELDVNFPDDYQATHLAGKPVKFSISVNEVGSPKLPKLDAEFAKKFGEDTMDKLLVSMKEQMRTEINGRIEQLNKDAIFGALAGANEFDVPQGSIDGEAQNLLAEMKDRMQQQGQSAPDDMPATVFNDEAERRVKLGLMVSQIASDNNMVASMEQIDEKIAEMSQAYGENAQQMVDYYNEDVSRKSSVELMIVEKMVQDKILEGAKIKPVKKKFTEITEQG